MSAPERHAKGADLYMPVVFAVANIRHQLAEYRIFGTRLRV